MTSQAVAERTAEANGLGTGRPSAFSRVYGLGSVFGKTLRDMRNAVIAISLIFAAITVGTASQLMLEFDTIESRRLLVAQMDLLPPIFHGLLGEPINIETLPGFLSWRLMGFMPLLIGIWAITALAGTLAGEAGRGTLEIILATPVSRVRLAAQKLGAITVGISLALLIAGVLTWLGTLAFAVLPGDEAALGAVLAEFSYVLIMAVFFGAIAFALGPVVGRGVAAGATGGLMFGAYMVNGYADLVPGFDTLRVASPFYWTLQHRPMAGASDWPAVLLVATLAAGFAALGLWLFRQRDLNDTVRLPGVAGTLAVGARAGNWSLGGPGRRTLGQLLPDALGWGTGLGLYGLFIAVSAEQFAEVLSSIPQIGQIIERFYPGLDLASAGGLLQLSMFNFAALLVGLASATLVGAWASDETERRLEIVLASPIERISWALRSGTGLLVSLLILTTVMALGIAIGVAIMGDPLADPVAGTFVLGLYGAALTGVGLLVAGLGWPHRAALAVGGLAVATWLLDFLGGILNLPEHISNLALMRHLGMPMAGSYNELGMAACAVLALGGLAFGALAFRRRDVRG